MFSATTRRIPAHFSAYGDASRLDPLPRRFPLTATAKPPSFTEFRPIGNSPPARNPT